VNGFFRVLKEIENCKNWNEFELEINLKVDGRKWMM